MAEEGTTTAGTGGDVAGKPDAGTAPQTTSPGTTTASEGKPGGKEGTTAKGTQEEQTFFDPKDLDPSLMPAYKNMQKAFTKRMQEAAQHKHKIEAYDSFEKDPVGTLQAMAQRMGFHLTRAEAAQQLNQQQGQQGQQQQWEPKSWDEVLTRAKDMAKRELLQEMGPVVNEVRNLRKSNLEAFLDSNAPDWREHEDAMMDNLKAHPTLVNDPVKLYRLSVPPEVLEGRAMQKALKKMEDKAKGTQISGGSSTTRKTPLGLPDKSMNFDEAVKYAKAKLAEEGIHEPGR